MTRFYLAPMLIVWFFLTCMSLVPENEAKTYCTRNKHCPQEHCCIQNECMAFIPLSQRCNIFTQFLSLQCPCVIGTSCTQSRCNAIHNSFDDEVIEDMDKYHIENNSLDP